MQVFRLVESDAERFRALRLKALQECPDAFTSSYAHDHIQPLDWYREMLREQAIFAYGDSVQLLAMAGLHVAKRQEKIVHKGLLWGVYADASLRGKGVMRMLLEQLMAHAQASGLELLQLGVGTYNTGAIKLYQSLGFVEYGVEKHALKMGERYIDEILMVREF